MEIEVWKDIPEYEGIYQISNFGRVKSLERNINCKDGRKSYIVPEKILKPQSNGKGYLNIFLYKNNNIVRFYVHKLVALIFLENDNPTEKTEINHLDENKENNHVDNLCWCNRYENINYGTRNERVGEKMKGKNNPMYGKHLSEEHKQKISKSKKGKPLYNKRVPIIQYTKDMVFFREFDSATTASQELNIYRGNIVSCCNNKRKTCGDFIWKYKE